MKAPVYSDSFSRKGIALSVLMLFCLTAFYLFLSFNVLSFFQKALFSTTCVFLLLAFGYAYQSILKIKKNKRDEFFKKEQLFTTLLDNTTSVIFIKDLTGKYLFINKECEKRFHIKYNETVGKTDYEIFSKEISDKYAETDREVIEKQTLFEREEASIHEDGIHTYINAKFPLYNKDNEFYAICGIGTDITSRKKAEEEILHAKDEAEHAKEMEEHFLANASHEIRTPMNGIIGMTRQLMETKLTEKQLDIANTISDSANNLLVIINDLLDLSKIKAGKIELEEKDFRLADIFKKLEQTLHTSIIDNHISFQTSIDNSIPVALLGDVGKINQILMNLAGNSIKFTHDGEVKVSVRQKQNSKELIQLEFKVSDTGIGIPKDKLERIFESFTQINQSGVKKYGGTGLGLTIAKQLIEQQGGEVIVNSQLGRGTVFTFTLMLKKGSLENIIISEKLKTSRTTSSYDFSNATVLLVEDNKINQRIATHDLKRWKVNVLIANDASEAIDILRSKKVDIVLMDIAMPGMNGYEATEYIRTKLPHPINNVPIIAMTASALSTEKSKCFDVGMNDYISKPFEPHVLYQKIAQYIELVKPEIITRASEEKMSQNKKIATLEILKEHADGDLNYISEILSDCLIELPIYMNELIVANSESNLEAVKFNAHKLKAPIALIGAEEIKKVLHTLEVNIGNNELLDKVPEQVESLTHQMEKLYEELRLEIETTYSKH